MIGKEEMMKRIVYCLTWLTTYVQQSNKLGWTDINHSAEDFYCGLLNKAFGWKLCNQNAMEMDFPAIDLGDRENHVCVQVTSTIDRSKVQQTLDKFFAHGLDSEYGYERLFLLIIGQKPDYRTPFRVKEGFDFDPEQHVWDTATLIKKLNGLDMETVKEVSEYIYDNLRLPSGMDCTLKLPMPDAMSDEVFIGREAELKALAKGIADPARKCLYVTGLGGMGKTVLVLKFCADYVRSQSGGNVYFVRFRESFAQTVAINVADGIRDNPPAPENAYDAAMEQLRRCGSRDILIIDNADEKNRDFSRLRDETFEELRKLDLKLIITTRCPMDGAIEVGAMETNLLRQIFRHHGVNNLQNTLRDDLIEAVGRHTMTVDLIARTLKHNCLLLKPDELLKMFRDGTLPVKKLLPVESGREDARQEQIYIHLRNLFKVTDVSEEARNLLRHAVLLPEGGMAPELFLAGLAEDAQYAAQNMADWGWLSLEGEQSFLVIHPVIRLVCRAELNPNDDICRPFLDAVWGQFSRKEYDAVKYRQYAELFSQASQILGDSQGEWALRAGVFWHQIGRMDEELRYELLTVEKREKNTQNPLELAVAYGNLGNTYSDLGNYESALEYHRKALDISQEILPEENPIMAHHYNNIGGAFSSLGDYDKALEYQLKALEIRKKILPPWDMELATSYNNVGTTYRKQGVRWKELDYLHKAMEIYEKILPADHPTLAAAYNNVSSTYLYMGNHRKELDYQLKALNIKEKALPPEHPDMATTYNNLGCAYDRMKDYDKALEYKLKALEIREKILPQEHPDIAVSYNNLGHTYGKLGDDQKKLDCYLKALEIWEKALPADHPDLADAYQNVGKLYYTRGDYENALEYEEKALIIAELRLPPDHLDLASAYNRLGMTCWKLDRKEQELEYFWKALSIRMKRLPDDDPELATSFNNVAATCADMGEYALALRLMSQALETAKIGLSSDDPNRKKYAQRVEEYRQKLEQQRWEAQNRVDAESHETPKTGKKKKPGRWWNIFSRRKD